MNISHNIYYQDHYIQYVIINFHYNQLTLSVIYKMSYKENNKISKISFMYVSRELYKAY